MGKAGRYFILLMELSFWGWAVETVFFFCCYGRFFDRGFMTLPFCTIYGCSFLLVDLLVGEENPSGGWEAAGYVLVCAAVPTALELVTGIFFHRVFDLRLWSYDAYRFHLNGYICLEYALLWGALVPACMRYVVAPMKRRVFSLPKKTAAVAALVLLALALTDWTVNFFRQQVALPGFLR